jgi:hypothetical protein
MNKKDIIDAWEWIRSNNTDDHIPDDVLDLMKNAAIERLSTPASSEDVEELAKKYADIKQPLNVKDYSASTKRIYNAFKDGYATSKEDLETRLIKTMQEVNDLQLENIRLKEGADSQSYPIWRCIKCSRVFDKRKAHTCNETWNTGTKKSFEAIEETPSSIQEAMWDVEKQTGYYPDKIHHGEMKVKPK